MTAHLVPRIGVAVGSETRRGRRFDATPHEYVTSVVNAGGLPLLIPPSRPELAAKALAGFDALLLTGGGDVSPARYRARLEPETADVDDERDLSELALVEAARRNGIPILGICRGAQLLNVAYGGTLHQDLPGKRGTSHRQPRHRFETVHPVDLQPGCLLAELIGGERLNVNSIHHQGVDRVGAGLAAVGFSSDGLVEVIEDRENNVLAVQWHPECLPLLKESAALFGWLIAEARTVSSPAG
jgi:putative glutamine amidotransferase